MLAKCLIQKGPSTQFERLTTRLARTYSDVVPVELWPSVAKSVKTSTPAELLEVRMGVAATVRVEPDVCLRPHRRHTSGHRLTGQ